MERPPDPADASWGNSELVAAGLEALGFDSFTTFVSTLRGAGVSTEPGKLWSAMVLLGWAMSGAEGAGMGSPPTLTAP